METPSGKLFVVATPIGNMKDITLRAIEVLEHVDLILAEDTREAKKLLLGLNIQNTIVSYHQHSTDTARLKIFELIQAGKQIALITDAGTPGISDPGNELISFLVTFKADIEIIPVPGVSSLTTLLSVCGFKTQQFSFVGFLPKKGKRKLWESLLALSHPFVFFESPHRIVKTLQEMSVLFPDDTKIVLGRELTKLHETILRGNVKNVIAELNNALPVRGEIVVVVDSPHASNIPS